jgi:hypothetical protein
MLYSIVDSNVQWIRGAPCIAGSLCTGTGQHLGLNRLQLLHSRPVAFLFLVCLSPDIISLHFCTPNIAGVYLQLNRVHNIFQNLSKAIPARGGVGI